MTEERYDETMGELARTAEMDAEAVTALEQRLLQAFTDHHAAPRAGSNGRSLEIVAALGCRGGGVCRPRSRSRSVAGIPRGVTGTRGG